MTTENKKENDKTEAHSGSACGGLLYGEFENQGWYPWEALDRSRECWHLSSRSILAIRGAAISRLAKSGVCVVETVSQKGYRIIFHDDEYTCQPWRHDVPYKCIDAAIVEALKAI